jgi:hypothetical protein
MPSCEFALDDNPQVCKREKTGRDRVSHALHRIVDDAVAEAETAVVETSLKLNQRSIHDDSYSVTDVIKI